MYQKTTRAIELGSAQRRRSDARNLCGAVLEPRSVGQPCMGLRWREQGIVLFVLQAKLPLSGPLPASSAVAPTSTTCRDHHGPRACLDKRSCTDRQYLTASPQCGVSACEASLGVTWTQTADDPYLEPGCLGHVTQYNSESALPTGITSLNPSNVSHIFQHNRTILLQRFQHNPSVVLQGFQHNPSDVFTGFST
jgi:hypothetical protein